MTLKVAIQEYMILIAAHHKMSLVGSAIEALKLQAIFQYNQKSPKLHKASSKVVATMQANMIAN